MMGERVYRCVSWVAVSSGPQAERESPKDQRQRNEEFIRNLGRYYIGAQGVLVKTIEIANSRSLPFLADAVAQYPQYAALDALIRARAFDLLVCRSRDRLGRTATLIGELERLCLQHGIVVVPRMSLPASLDAREMARREDGSILPSIESVIAELEVRRLVERNRMGMRARVIRRRLFPNIIPFGYRIVRQTGEEPTIAVDPDKAAIVRLILIDLFLKQGLRPRQIADYLNAQGLKSARNRPWTYSNVQRVIHYAKRYAGYLESNCFSRTGREYGCVEDGIPAIITKDEWQQIVELTAERRRGKTRTGVADSRPLVRIAYCAVCGRLLKGVACQRKDGVTYSMRCSRLHVQIKEDRLFAAIREAILFLTTLDDDAMLRYLETMAPDPATAKQRAQLAEAEARVRQIEERRQRLLTAYIDLGLITEKEFASRITPVIADLKEAQNQIQRLTESSILQSAAEDRRARLFALRAAGRQMLDRWTSDPHAVGNWLRGSLSVYVLPKAQIQKIEFH